MTQARRPGALTGCCWRGLGVQEGRLRWFGETDIIRERVLTGTGAGDWSASAAPWDGSRRVAPVMVGEAACRYPGLGVAGNLAEGSLGVQSSAGGYASRGVRTIADGVFAGAFHGARGTCCFAVVEVDLREACVGPHVQTGGQGKCT